MSERPRTVVVAYSANPNSPASVPLIGYQVARHLGDITDVTVIAHRRDGADLLTVFKPEQVVLVGSKRFAALIRAISTRLFPGRWGLISMLDFPDYLVFDFGAFFAARRLLRRRKAAYVLRVNPVSFRFPSLLARLKAPVFTGPHNGGIEWPAGFRHLDARERTGTRWRGVGDAIHRLYGDVRRYAGIFAAHEECAAVVPAAYRDKVVLLSENAVEALGTPGPHAGDARRLLFVGRLATFKVVDTVVRAMARLPEDVRLTIVGDGPERSTLESLASELGVIDRIDFAGHRPHAEVAAFYKDAGVFVFPSVRESGGGVVLEAMSYGLPCLVAAWGGPRLYTESTGIALRVDSPQVLEDDLVAAIRGLLEDPAEARRIGERSREVIRDGYLWHSKLETLHAHAMKVASH